MFVAVGETEKADGGDSDCEALNGIQTGERAKHERDGVRESIEQQVMRSIHSPIISCTHDRLCYVV